jgi:(p)ppGpp synthase/HD superfamily hydrolase
MTRIEQAKQFAHEAHDSIKQVRKYTGEPYWVHTDEVAGIVAAALTDGNQAINLTGNRSAVILSPTEIEDAVCAAHLHDVIEDVFLVDEHYDLFLIGDIFGRGVADLVVALTDVYVKEAWPGLNREKRKNLERERIAKTSRAAKTIKLADLISNTKSIVEHDPDFARVYLKEKLALLPYLKEGDATLFARCQEQIITLGPKVGLDIPLLAVRV